MSELQPQRRNGFWAGHSEDSKGRMPERKMENGTAAEFSMGPPITAGVAVLAKYRAQSTASGDSGYGRKKGTTPAAKNPV
jgi:hypothetical protein